MIEYVGGDILGLSAIDTDAIVIPTNCKGVFGAGLAHDFAHVGFRQQYEDGTTKNWLRYAGVVRDYTAKCERGEVKPGDVFGANIDHDGPGTVLLVPTKDDWRDPSQMEWVETGLANILDFCKKQGVVRVSIPLLGAGLGRLSANAVARAARSTFSEDPDVRAFLHLPGPMLHRIRQ